MNAVTEYNFESATSAGLLICAGGFENRSLAFVRRLSNGTCRLEECLLLEYVSQSLDNQPNHKRLVVMLEKYFGRRPDSLKVHSAQPNQAYALLQGKIKQIAGHLNDKRVLVDISGMTQLLALCVLHGCWTAGLDITVVYTEARSYFPLKSESQPLLAAWEHQDYKRAAKYLQSESLGNIHILPEFAGTGVGPTCLIVFVGYEPNRIEGLLDYYAPDRLIVCYGRSPHPQLQWRIELSKKLHKRLLSTQHVREVEVSTFDLIEIMNMLEHEFTVLHQHYDIAIAPHCAKMQAVASYLFWRSHPEVQLVFTSPARFNPQHYSSRAGHTYCCHLPTRSRTNTVPERVEAVMA